MLLDERNINLLESLHVPNTYWNKRSIEYKYWFRSLLQKIDSSIIFENIPTGWNDDFFHLCLWVFGFVGVFKPVSFKDAVELSKYGMVLFNPGTIQGFDFYYQPTTFRVSNPNAGKGAFNKEFTIGTDCELIKLTPDYCGILDIIDYYASKLAEISKGIDVGIINAKMPLILTAKNEAQAETLKKVYDKVQSGESLVVWKNAEDGDEIIPSKDPFDSFVNDYQKTYVVHNLLEDMQGLLDSFYTEIGLPVALDKKERLITSEADFASAQSQARISCWLETLKESFDRVNKMFGTNISAYASYEDNEKVGEDSERPNNSDRN